MDPAVERGDGDAPVLAETGHGTMPVKVCKKDCKDEPQGIGPERNEAVREKGMRAAAGITPEPGDYELGIRTPAVIDRDHEPPIGTYPGEPADGTALGTAAGGRLKTGNCDVKELLVRKMQLV